MQWQREGAEVVCSSQTISEFQKNLNLPQIQSPHLRQGLTVHQEETDHTGACGHVQSRTDRQYSSMMILTASWAQMPLSYVG